MIDKKFVLMAVALLAVPAVSAVALPTGTRQKAAEIRQENMEQRKLMNETIFVTKTQMREEIRNQVVTLKKENVDEWIRLMESNQAEWKELNQKRLAEIQALKEKYKMNTVELGPMIAEINKKYAELAKSLRATNMIERKDLKVTNTMQRKELRVSVTQQRKDTYQNIKTTRSTFQEQVKSNWQNFWGMFKPKPTVTVMPTITQ